MLRLFSESSGLSRRISQIWLRISHALLDAVFPPKCLACGALFHVCRNGDLSQNGLHALTYEKVMSPFLCPECRPGFMPAEVPVYGGQLTPPKRFRIAWAAGIYQKDHAFGTLIHRYKYNNRVYLSEPLGLLLFSTFVERWLSRNIDFIVPVPLHIRKFRKRGFNQAYLLIREWPRIARQLHLDLGGAEIRRGLLIRTRKTRPQVGLKPREREKNIRGAFGLGKGADVRGKKIVLVDDVLTTGATADQCARVLLEAGAAYVGVLTLARPCNSDDDVIDSVGI